MRSNIFHIRIKEWFPADDPIAVVLAKLCVLREDYLLELAGIVMSDEPFGKSKPTYGALDVDFDENSSGWRKMYFYRNSLRTLYEIRQEIDNVYGQGKSREALEKESKQFRDAFAVLSEKMKLAADRVERIRHNLGGHVDSGAIKKSLRDMPHGTMGIFQDSEIIGKRRYKFVGEIVLRAMLPDVSENEMENQLEELLDETEQLLDVFRLIDRVLVVYIEDRRLLAD